MELGAMCLCSTEKCNGDARLKMPQMTGWSDSELIEMGVPKSMVGSEMRSTAELGDEEGVSKLLHPADQEAVIMSAVNILARQESLESRSSSGETIAGNQLDGSLFFSRVLRDSTTLFVGPTDQRTVRPSVHHTLLFSGFCSLWPHCSCPNDEVTSNTVPAHPHATGVAVYPALLKLQPAVRLKNFCNKM